MNSATHVPVGEDQSQHLEFARECVTNFNHAYGPHLVEPKTIMCKYLFSTSSTVLLTFYPAPAKRVMSLQNPRQKMSKSHPDPRSRILITDSPSTIKANIMSALTDSINSVSYDPINRPGVSNLLTLLSHFEAQGISAEELGEAYSHMGLGEFKALVADAITVGLEGVRSEYERILGEEGFIESVEKEGGRRARESAEETMVLVREAVGF
jgi:tryptophanyl-tRNA synthetase